MSYDSAYYERGFGGRMAGAFSRFSTHIMARHLTGGEKGGRLLEVGFGRGALLKEVRALGWEVSGVEVSKYAVDNAREAGLEAHLGDLLDANLEDNSFDVVVFRHVLEHIEKPLRAVEEAHRILKPGGRLVIRVPNIDSIESRLAGQDWFHLDVIYHLHNFTPASLSLLLGQAGFCCVKVSHFPLEYRQVMAYSLVSRLRPGDPRKSRSSLALAAFAMPASIALSYLCSLLGRGGTIEATARK